MPVQLMASQLVQPTQFLLRSDVLSSVLFQQAPPANAPQPLGSTPFWSPTTPDGTNNGVFHDAATGTAVYFPSYAIATFDDGKPQVKFSQPVKSNVATTLTITLKPSPPTSAQTGATRVNDARIPIVVQLFFSSGTKELGFDQIVPDDSTGNLVCTAHMTDATTIGEVMGSLVGHDSQGPHAWITVTRTISVGVPASQPTAPTQPTQSTPPKSTVFTTIGTFKEPQELHTIASKPQTLRRAPLLIATEKTIPVDSPAWRLHFPFPTHDPGPNPPASNPPPPAAPLYTILPGVVVATSVKDVWFLDTISGDLTSDVTGVQPMQAGYEQHTVAGYDQPLFRDVNSETAFYYLPDAFKIARRATAPFLPLIDVVLHGATLDDAQATIFFTALPVVDVDKLNAAHNSISAEHPGQTITLEPLPTPQNIEYGLYLPGTTPFSKRTVPVALNQALTDSVDLSLADFQTVLASLTAPVPKYLQGKITVHVGDNIENVPLVARADDFPGPYFQQTRSVDDASAAIRLTLVNSVESAVQVDALPINATRGGVAVSCSVVCDPPLPATIAAADDDNPTGAALRVTITPASGPLDDTLRVVVDQSRCHVVPDAAGLLRAVLDPDAPIQVSRPVSVKIPTVLFGTEPEPPPSPKNIIGIAMTFQNGNTVNLLRPKDLSAVWVAADPPGTVSLSVSDYLLRQSSGESSPIRYKLAITYSTGHTVTDAEWRSSPVDSIRLDLP
jgi:hypothetical protein